MILLQLLLAFLYAHAATTLSPAEAQALMNQVIKCKDAKCSENMFSKKMSKLEFGRTLERLKKFKIESKGQWQTCQLNIKKLNPDESCYVQIEAQTHYVQMFFVNESGFWKIQSVSWPIQD